jgi:subtilisin
MVALYPRANYWSRVIEFVDVESGLDVVLTPLPAPHTEIYDWGHVHARMRDGAGNAGERVRIGIIDSGICRDHPDLRPYGGANCVFNEDPARWYEDSDGHGTHCAGIVAAL